MTTPFLVAVLLTIGIYFRKPLPKIKYSLQPKPLKQSSKNKSPKVAETRATVDLLVLTISSGMTIPSAITTTSEICKFEFASKLGNAIKNQMLGGDFSTEMTELANRDRYWKLVGNQLKQSWDHGSMIMENLVDLSEYLVDLERSQTMQKVRSAGVRSVLPLGLCFLPAFLLVVVVPLIASLIPN